MFETPLDMDMFMNPFMSAALLLCVIITISIINCKKKQKTKGAESVYQTTLIGQLDKPAAPMPATVGLPPYQPPQLTSPMPNTAGSCPTADKADPKKEVEDKKEPKTEDKKNETTKTELKVSKKTPADQTNGASKQPKTDKEDAEEEPPIVKEELVQKLGNLDAHTKENRQKLAKEIAEMPSVHDLEKRPVKIKNDRVRINDNRCKVYETNNEPTREDEQIED